MRKIWIWGLVLCLAVFPARADEYEKPSLANFMKTLVRFGAIDLRRDDIIDAYGRINECDLYFEYFKDDFKWQRIRSALRQSIKQNVATFPVAYQFDAELQLDRYDFKAGLFRFTNKTVQASSNVFSMRTQESERCVQEGVQKDRFPPEVFKFVLDKPVKMLGIPMNAKTGERLLANMEAQKNKDRLVYVRFKFRIGYIAPLSVKRPETAETQIRRGAKSYGPMVTQDESDEEVAMDARADAIEYYEDPARTKLIYSYTP